MKNSNKKFIDKIKKSKYYQAAEEGFWRIWKNKSIWFWGLFIGTGTSYSFFESKKESHNSEYTYGSFRSFLDSHWQWIILAIVLFVTFCIVFWLVSIVVRAGIVSELNNKQNKSKYKLGFKKIWMIGKKFFIRVFVLDLFFLALVLSAVILFLFFLIPLIITENSIFFFLIILALILFLSFMFIITILKPLALIFTVLSKINPKESFIKSRKVVKNNFIEFLKLTLTYIIINFMSSLIFIVVIALTGLLAFYFYNYSLQDGNELLLFGSLGVIWLVAVFIFVLTVRAFVSLWRVDVLIWWVKMIKAEKAENKKTSKKIKVPKKKRVLAEAKV